MVQLSKEVVNQIETTIDEACKDQRNGIPGATVVVIDRNGKELIAHAGGHRGSESSQPMKLDSVYWIASCTKMIVGIACMQLVEKKVLSLDDADQLEKLCPELRDVKVIGDDGKLIEKRNRVTLRMLLSHTGLSSLASFFAIPTSLLVRSGIRIHLFQREAERLQ